MKARRSVATVAGPVVTVLVSLALGALLGYALAMSMVEALS